MANIQEEARIPVYINDEQAKSALKTLQNEAEKWKKSMWEATAAGDVEGAKKAEDALKKVNRQVSNLKREAFDANKVLQNLAGASLSDLRKTEAALIRQRDGVNRNTKEWKEYQAQLAKVVAEKRKINAQMGTFLANKGPLSGFIGVAKGLLPALGLTVGLSTLISVGREMVKIRSEYEKYEAILKNSLGSQKAAKDEMRMLQEFASKTPFALSELTGSFVKLTNYGLKPTREEMRKYGDLAASVGKSFDQLTEAVADAVTGEFERLKEFGIKAKKEGDKITFTFKEQATVVDYNAQSIKNYIQSLGDLEGVKGSTEAIAKTVGGQISNMGDAWDNVMNRMGERTSGVMSFILDTITGTLGKIAKGFEIMESNELSWFEKWMGSTIRTDAMYDRMLERRNANAAKAAQNAAAANGIQNLFGVSTFNDVNPSFVPGAKPKTDAELKAEQEAKAKAKKDAEEKQKQVEEAFKKAQEAYDKAAIEEKNKLKQQLLDKKLTQEQFNLEMYSLELAHLIAMKALREKFSQETATTDAQILDKKLEGEELANKKLEDMLKFSKQIEDDNKKEQQKADEDFLNEQANLNKKDTEQRQESTEKQIEQDDEKIKAAEELREMQIAAGVDAGMAAVESAETIQEAGKAVLNTIRDQIKAYIAEAVITAALKALKSVPFPFNMIAATVAGAGATFLFNKLIPEFSEGGDTGDGGKYDVAGIVHKKEYVIPSEGTQNPMLRPVIDMIEIARRNGTLARLDLRPVVQMVGAKGLATGGYTSSDSSSAAIQNPGSSFQNPAIDRETAIRLIDAIDKFTKKELKVYSEMIKKDIDALNEIEEKRNM